MSRVAELVWRSNNRSVIRDLEQMSAQSERTGHRMQHDARETITVYERLGKTTVALRERVSGLAGIVGLGGLAFGLKDAVQGGIRLQGAQAQLQSSLKATGLGIGDTNKQLREYAERLSTRGGFGAPENLSALAAFVRETHSASKAQQGLALATDIARGRGIDLGSAQMVVQRAYGGSIGRLQALLGPMVAVKNAQFGLTQAHKEQVVQLDAQAKAMGKAGPAWLRQQEVLRGVTPQMQALAVLQDKSATGEQVIAAAEKVFGGATGAFAGSTQGKVSNLQHSFQNLTDTTGERLLPAVNMLVKDATTLVNLFGRLPAPLQAGILGLTAIGLLLAPLRAGFSILADMARGAGSLISRLGGSAGVAAPEVARLGAAAEVAAVEEGGGPGALGGGAKRAEKGAAKDVGKLARFARGGFGLLRYAPAVGGVIITGQALEGIIKDRVGHPVHSPIFGNKRFGPGGYADGGDTPYPGTFMVGERGPELVNLPGGAHITPNHQLGAQNITLNVQLRMPNGRLLAEEVIKYALNRGARGPTSFVGGSLVTGAPGLVS